MTDENEEMQLVFVQTAILKDHERPDKFWSSLRIGPFDKEIIAAAIAEDAKRHIFQMIGNLPGARLRYPLEGGKQS